MKILQNIRWKIASAVLSVCAVSTVSAETIDLKTPEGIIEATRKIYE